MLNALQLSCVTGLTGAEMETLLGEAGVTVTKGSTINRYKRNAVGGKETDDILTDDECRTLREYVASEATGIAKQANIVWTSLENWFRDDSPIINTVDNEPSNDGVDPFGDDLDGLDDDDLGNNFDDEQEEEGFDDEQEEEGFDDDLDDDDLSDDLDDDLDDDLGEQGDDIDSLLNDDSNTPVEYDRSGMEADPDNKVFPDSEANISTGNAIDDLFG